MAPYQLSYGAALKGRFLLAGGVLIIISLFFYTLSLHSPQTDSTNTPSQTPYLTFPSKPDWPWRKPDESLPSVPCLGPRGKLLNESIDDQLRPLYFPDVDYPEPMTGAYEPLGINKTWYSASARYGPYGYGEEKEGYDRSRVDWKSVKWGALQEQCAAANSMRIPQISTFDSQPRFEYRRPGMMNLGANIINARTPDEKTGRQAIVIRTWSTYNYTQDDLQNLRSIVAEASLAKSGAYSVFLLVDVKDLSRKIHHSAKNYQAELNRAVPAEFRDMAVLFDVSLQKSWYASIEEFRPLWQIMQPFQLFAHFYPEFDHYWQIEMDTRFMGHTGDMLDSFHKFGRDQPRKQARERSSWSYMPRFHHSYDNFTSTLNATLNGTSADWGPVIIGDEIIPIGPKPPTKDPRDDNFEWGVGEDADALVASSLQDSQKQEDWGFSFWHYGFTKYEDLPFWMSAPAQGRASWNLLNAIHHAQSMQDLRVPSEATLPSFALWHGLKLVALPLPIFQTPERDRREMDFVVNGGPLDRFEDGIAMGGAKYRGATSGFFTSNCSWDWTSPMPDNLMRYWKEGHKKDADFPHILLEHEGEILSPNILLHPRKTNSYRSDVPSNKSSSSSASS